MCRKKWAKTKSCSPAKTNSLRPNTLSFAACSARGGWGRNHFRANDDKLICRPLLRVKGAYCQVLEMGPSLESHSTAGDPGPRSHTTGPHALESWSHAVDAVPRLSSESWGRVSIRTMHGLCACHRLKCGQAREGRRRKCTCSTLGSLSAYECNFTMAMQDFSVDKVA